MEAHSWEPEIEQSLRFFHMLTGWFLTKLYPPGRPSMPNSHQKSVLS